MKAVGFRRYGDVDVLEVFSLPRPICQHGQVLIKVHASSVNPKDTFIRKGRFRWLTGQRFPQWIGFDFAGEVVESSVTECRVGNRVFGMLDGWRGGACADYVLAQPDQIAQIPDHVPFEQAAAVPLVGLTALQALRDHGRMRAGQRVAINGASGGVGSMAVQIARYYDAHITAIASASNHDFLYELGADVCLDYRTHDLTKIAQPFDAVFDVFGNTRYAKVKPILTDSGVWISTVLQAHVFVSMAFTLFSRQRAHLVVVKSCADDLALLADWMREGQLRAIIQIYPLHQIAEAHAQQQSKHSRGKLVIRL
ncbi:MAG: NAD(P)-dependent alcohol dehydrogenase [Anaerolineae bacterium]